MQNNFRKCANTGSAFIYYANTIPHFPPFGNTQKPPARLTPVACLSWTLSHTNPGSLHLFRPQITAIAEPPQPRRQPVYLRLDFPHLRRISGCRGFVGLWITKSAKARENHEIPFAPFVQFRALRDPNARPRKPFMAYSLSSGVCTRRRIPNGFSPKLTSRHSR